MNVRTGPFGLPSLVIATTIALGAAAPAGADTHLPIIDIVPTTSWTLTSDGIDPQGGPKNPAATNGYTELNGTVTIPVTSAFSLSYNRQSNGVLDSNLSSVAIGGRTIYPGGTRDLFQSYIAGYRFGRFNVGGGFASRYRRCCPADSFEWHKGFLDLSYATPSVKELLNSFIVLDVTANRSRHHSSPEALAAIPPGLSLPNDTIQYTTQQAVTAVIPVDPKHGFTTSATLLWGALDYPVNGPFPYYFNFTILSATKVVTPEFSVTANVVNVKQRPQGAPFPAPYGIDTSALSVLADFHVDLNKVLHHAPAAASAPAPVPVSSSAPGPGIPQSPTQAAPAPAGAPAPVPSATASP